MAIEDGGGADLNVERGVALGIVFLLIVALFVGRLRVIGGGGGFGKGVLDHDGSVLTTARSIGGDVDDKLRVGRLAGFKAIGRFGESEPVLEVSIGTVGRKVGVVGVVVDVVGGGFEGKIEGEAADIGDGDRAFVWFARGELDDLLGRADRHDEVADFESGDRGQGGEK